MSRYSKCKCKGCAHKRLTDAPTFAPTRAPTGVPTVKPTKTPSTIPTFAPTHTPSTPPSNEPSSHPTRHPTLEPTDEPTRAPTELPTMAPTRAPSTPPCKDAPVRGHTKQWLACAQIFVHACTNARKYAMATQVNWNVKGKGDEGYTDNFRGWYPPLVVSLVSLVLIISSC